MPGIVGTQNMLVIITFIVVIIAIVVTEIVI